MGRKQRRNTTTDTKEQDVTESVEQGTVHIPTIGDRVVFEVLQYPDKKLRQRSFEVKQSEINDDFKKLVGILKNTLFAEGGVGIAAPQVGWNKRIIVVLHRAFLEDTDKEPMVIFNPVLRDLSGEQDSTEACLSVPMPPAVVKRAEDCVVSGYDLEWNEVQFYTSGLEAAIIQHEREHLDGVLYIDKLSRLKRDILIRKYKKRQRELEYYATQTPRRYP